MAVQRTCDRCGVVVDPEHLLDGAPRSVVVPAGLPSTNPVDHAVNLELGLTSPNDICHPCLASTLLELAVGALGIRLTPAQLAQLSTRAADPDVAGKR